MTVLDRFNLDKGALSAPADHAFAIVPHAVNELEGLTRCIWVGTGGDVTLWTRTSATAILFKNVPSGFILPVRATRVLAIGTTATDLVGMW